MAADARAAKKAAKEEKVRALAKVRAKKERARADRVRRSAAFKRNVQKYGLVKAKYIANIICQKQKGLFVYTEKDGIRAK